LEASEFEAWVNDSRACRAQRAQKRHHCYAGLSLSPTRSGRVRGLSTKKTQHRYQEHDPRLKARRARLQKEERRRRLQEVEWAEGDLKWAVHSAGRSRGGGIMTTATVANARKITATRENSAAATETGAGMAVAAAAEEEAAAETSDAASHNTPSAGDGDGDSTAGGGINGSAPCDSPTSSSLMVLHRDGETLLKADKQRGMGWTFNSALDRNVVWTKTKTKTKTRGRRGSRGSRGSDIGGSGSEHGEGGGGGAEDDGSYGDEAVAARPVVLGTRELYRVGCGYMREGVELTRTAHTARTACTAVAAAGQQQDPVRDARRQHEGHRVAMQAKSSGLKGDIELRRASVLSGRNALAGSLGEFQAAERKLREDRARQQRLRERMMSATPAQRRAEAKLFEAGLN
jgi:hypothetical protein